MEHITELTSAEELLQIYKRQYEILLALINYKKDNEWKLEEAEQLLGTMDYRWNGNNWTDQE